MHFTYFSFFYKNISALQKELEQRIKSLESELKQSKDEAAQLRSEKSSSAINVPDFSERVKELEEK